ncbi:glycosyltransferase [Kordiimonas aestuarii]|uniref:glycosyltransferase n=1 Tax=Kordiimonas aestuarii TaxID=1005925 RepID=UPI0021D088EB|nr:glycosyltransferase [Kordiimonas aestuarii]
MTDKRLNILVFSSLFPNAVDPVLGVFVENRLRHFLRDTGHTATVVAPVPWFPFRGRIWGRYGRYAAVPAREIRAGVEVFHPRFLVLPKVGMAFTPGSLARAGERCIRGLLRSGKKFDLIDAHYLYPDAVAATVVGRKFDLPVVMTARGSDVTEIARMKGPGKRIVKAADDAAHVIAVSNSLRDELLTMGVKAAKVTTLRNGVDAEKFSPAARQEIRAKWAGTGSVALYAGWLISRKRVDIFIDAVAKLGPDTTAVVAGEGPLLASLRQRAEARGIANRTVFLGKVAPADMPGVMAAADVLVLPSEREGWANVLLEAMACGTPVVSRAVAGALDLVTVPEAGALVEGDDPEAYADAMARLFADPPDRGSTRNYALSFGWREISLAQERIFMSVTGDEYPTWE